MSINWCTPADELSFYRLRLTWILFKDSVRNSQSTHHVSDLKISIGKYRCLFRELYNTRCEQKVEFFDVNRFVRSATNRVSRVTICWRWAVLPLRCMIYWIRTSEHGVSKFQGQQVAGATSAGSMNSRGWRTGEKTTGDRIALRFAARTHDTWRVAELLHVLHPSPMNTKTTRHKFPF